MDGKKYDNEDAALLPFQGLLKSNVLHEAKVFSDPQIDPRKCCHILTEISFLLSQGEMFKGNEATELFFGVTKLFSSQDVNLRRMVYRVIKSMNQNKDEVLIVIASLMKDVTGNVPLFRANAIRVLAHVIDASMLGQMERFIKQAIVDADPFVASSALLAGLHLFDTSADVIRRWVNEVQEALSSLDRMVQFQALALLYKIKSRDPRAISKVVISLARKPPKSALAQCLLIRYIVTVISHESPRFLLEFLHSCLHHKSTCVMYEAARALLAMPDVPESKLTSAISVLQEMLSSPIPSHRFAAVRTLNKVVSRMPVLVSPCSIELEHLISDSNRSIATLAVTTLLKTGVESSVDRLMKTITGFMSDITDELRVVMVEAIRTLCLKFPNKYETLMNFLSNCLREEGGYKFKREIVDSIFILMSRIPEAKSTGLEHLCEFIEDCEFPDLSIQILHYLGEEGPSTANPAKYIRFIFNRVILELPSVRSAAVSSLAKIGVKVPALKESIVILLKRCLYDNDDEVRDRVTLYIHVLDNDDEAQIESSKQVMSDLPVELDDLEYSLQQYLDSNAVSQGGAPFTLREVVQRPKPKRVISTEEMEAEERRESTSPLGLDSGAFVSPAQAMAKKLERELNAVPELKSVGLGELFKVSREVELTEEEAEYVVSCVKLIYVDHVVFRFQVKNGLDDNLLEDVVVETEFEDPDAWQEELFTSIPSLSFEQCGVCYTCVRRHPSQATSGPVACTLKFTLKDANCEDPSLEEGIEDEYQLENLEVLESDVVHPERGHSLVDFKQRWQTMGDAHEKVRKFNLSLKSLQGAVDLVIRLMSLGAVDSCATVPDGVTTHSLQLVGRALGDHSVLARAALMSDPRTGGVVLKMAIRSDDPDVSALVIGAIR